MKNKGRLIYNIFKIVVCCSVIVIIDTMFLDILIRIVFSDLMDKAVVDLIFPSVDEFTVKHFMFATIQFLAVGIFSLMVVILMVKTIPDLVIGTMGFKSKNTKTGTLSTGRISEKDADGMSKEEPQGEIIPHNFPSKTIIIGPPGSGKSYHTLQLVSEYISSDEGKTVFIADISTGLSAYIEKFPILKEFISADGMHSFNIENGKKYFVNGKELPAAYYSSLAEYTNSIIFGCDYGELHNNKNALIIYEDGVWNYQSNPLLTLWKLSHTLCNIIITVDSWSDLLRIPENEISDKMKEDIVKDWSVINVI